MFFHELVCIAFYFIWSIKPDSDNMTPNTCPPMIPALSSFHWCFDSYQECQWHALQINASCPYTPLSHPKKPFSSDYFLFTKWFTRGHYSTAIINSDTSSTNPFRCHFYTLGFVFLDTNNNYNSLYCVGDIMYQWSVRNSLCRIWL